MTTIYPQRSLDTAVQVRNDIADLQKQVKELQAQLKQNEMKFATNLTEAVKGLEDRSLKVGRYNLLLLGKDQEPQNASFDKPLLLGSYVF